MSANEKGFCWVEIGNSKDKLLSNFEKRFKNEKFRKVIKTDNKYFLTLTAYLEGIGSWEVLPFDLRSTDFKIKAWRYMQTIPAGQTQFYSQVAKAIGKPKAYRAVARACATNPILLVIPCHRVIPKLAGIGNFSARIENKQKLLEKEGYFIKN